MINSTKKNFNTKNTCVIALIIFYECLNEHYKVIMFKVLGAVIYRFYAIYVCIDYLCLHHDKLSKKNPFFKVIISEYFSGIGIPDVSMSIMYCQIFSRGEHYVTSLQNGDLLTVKISSDY